MPRSASRDLADRFIGNRGYFRRPDAVRRAKVWLALVALGLSAGWVLLDTTDPQRAAYSHSHGPLANPHAAWDNTCEACHKPFDGSSSLSVFNARGRWHDMTCEKCHAGPAHHATVTASGAAFHKQCSNCHHDHGGRGNSLVRISDSHCTKCHENLAANHAAGESEFESRVTAFDKHPEFGLLRAYPPSVPGPRGLKFSHSVHMTPGVAYGRTGGLTPASMKVRFGDDTDRYRTPGQPDDAPIQMTCAMCHQLDAGLPATTGPTDGAAGKAFDVLRAALKDQPIKSILPARAEGAYYLPVNFDAHCKTCHPLNTRPDSRGKVRVAAVALPHRKQPGELKQLLTAEYTLRLSVSGNDFVLPPTDRLDPRTPEQEAAFRGEVRRLTDDAMTKMLQGLTPRDKVPTRTDVPPETGGFACGKCHVAVEKRDTGEQPSIGPADTRVVWFRHAKFNHVSHRGLTCGECHPGTESRVSESGKTQWADFEPIRIRGVKSCQQCHAPAGRQVEVAEGVVVTGGGVRHGCTDCHKYHNGDHALSGRGATARDPLRPLSVSEFLRGK